MNHRLTNTIDLDVVCPECYKPVPGASVLPAKKDRYNRPLRSYFGNCINCKAEFEVVQFQKEPAARWSIHMFRFYFKQGEEGRNIGGPWKILKPLPDPTAPVLTGPGGDFDQPVHIDAVDFLQRAHNALKSLTQTFDNLLKAVKRSREIDDGKGPL